MASLDITNTSNYALYTRITTWLHTHISILDRRSFDRANLGDLLSSEIAYLEDLGDVMGAELLRALHAVNAEVTV